EPQLRRGERRSWKQLQQCPRETTLGGSEPQPHSRVSSIGAITHDRVAEMREVHANLMGAPGLEGDLERRAPPEALHDPPARPGRLPAAAHHRHALAMPRVTPDRSIDQAFGRPRVPPYQG